jgi:hypothetical protein
MTQNLWNKETLQYLYLKLRNLGDLAKRLNLSIKDTRELLIKNEVKDPVNYVRSLDREELRDLILKLNGYLGASQFLGVSPSFLKTLYERSTESFPIGDNESSYVYVRRLSHENLPYLKSFILEQGTFEKAAKKLGVSESFLRQEVRTKGVQDRMEVPSKEDAMKAMETFGSAQLAAEYLRTSPSIIKKVLTEEWRSLRDPKLTGKNSTSNGRIGEEYYLKLRMKHITSSDSLDNHNNPGYDFIDDQYGKVNVKIARPRELKNRKDYVWYWSVDLSVDTNYLALVLLSKSLKPLGLFMVDKQVSNVPEGLKWTNWKSGSGFSYKSNTLEPSIELPPGFGD